MIIGCNNSPFPVSVDGAADDVVRSILVSLFCTTCFSASIIRGIKFSSKLIAG